MNQVILMKRLLCINMWVVLWRYCTDKEITSQLPDDAGVLEIERGTFTPVVFSTTGGMGIEASKLLKRIAERTERKTGQRYADVIVFHWLLDTRPHVEMAKNCPR